MEGLFHVHSDYSHDGRSSLQALVGFCLDRQFDFIVLSEHAESFNESKMQAYVQECSLLSVRKVILIPGLEFGFREYPGLHLLGIGIRKYISTEDIISTIDKIHDQGGIAVIAHPSRNGHYIPHEVIEKIDGLETWNAAYDSRMLPDHKSMKLFSAFRKRNKSLLAFSGLDMHDINGFRELVISMLGGEKNEKEIISNMKKGFFINKGKFMSFRPDYKISSPAYAMLMFSRLVLGLADYLYWKGSRLKKNLARLFSVGQAGVWK